MESAQRELVSALLEQLFSLGLISQTTYSKAEDLVHSEIDLPEFFQYPAGLIKEAPAHERAAGTP